MEAVSRQAVRILRLFGDTETTAGHCPGGTGAGVLPHRQGALPGRGEDLRADRPHPLRRQTRPGVRSWRTTTYGAIKPRVAAVHAGSGPGAVEGRAFPPKPSTTRWPPPSTRWPPIYTDANTACDHNQLAMELLKKVADRHGLVCLHPRKALCRRQRLRQARQLVPGHGHRQEPASSPVPDPQPERPVSPFPGRLCQGRGRIPGASAGLRGLLRQRPPSGRPGGTSCGDLHLPG